MAQGIAPSQWAHEGITEHGRQATFEKAQTDVPGLGLSWISFPLFVALAGLGDADGCKCCGGELGKPAAETRLRSLPRLVRHQQRREPSILTLQGGLDVERS